MNEQNQNEFESEPVTVVARTESMPEIMSTLATSERPTVRMRPITETP